MFGSVLGHPDLFPILRAGGWVGRICFLKSLPSLTHSLKTELWSLSQELENSFPSGGLSGLAVQTKKQFAISATRKNVKRGERQRWREADGFLGDSKLSTLQEIMPLEKIRLSWVRGWGPIRTLLVKRECQSQRQRERELKWLHNAAKRGEKKKFSFFAFVPARVSSESNKL